MKRFPKASKPVMLKFAEAMHRSTTALKDALSCSRFSLYNFTVLNGVLKLPNEVTLGEVWCVRTTVSD